ncbi:phytoene/squalene synthase family protein [Demequina aurantiaca]|uniref:phytoene/squalene synthase family protein n=1 Tax=Demequina aurantiaca TaxID=676200 RepID=UPI000A027A06|nr:squalene/phytoene synthase family protein [Demequina aurantiaca]
MSGSRRRVAHDNETSLIQYDEAAQAAAAQVIRRYSTSFGVGARMLPRPMRRHIESIYAMVRIADEVVDTYRGADAGAALDGFEATVTGAMAGRFSTDVVAHAFGVTARAVGITTAMTGPFFASMRADLTVAEHDDESFARYVYGSAEVVGEMCLAVFLNTESGPAPLPSDASEGARRLGAAYQKVNFLRDLATDAGELGRSYFPGIDAATLTNTQVAELVADCRADIDAARACLPALPRRASVAVSTTIDIYTRLLDTIADTDAKDLARRRVRVPNTTKLVFAARNTWDARRAGESR